MYCASTAGRREIAEIFFATTPLRGGRGRGGRATIVKPRGATRELMGSINRGARGDSLKSHAEQLPLLLIPLEPTVEIRDPICVCELLKDY